MLYQSRARLIDNVNGLVIPFGSYVDTEETAWVARFGADLKRVYGEEAPGGVEIIKVENTIEGKAKTEEKPKEEESSQKVKLQQRKSAKVVEGEGSENK